jgi:DNA-directed RNA polymerase specialized sigma24 family protein
MATDGSENGSAPRVARVFATTQWSVVLLAADSSSSEAAGALENLCRAYWYPLYAYVRRKGHSPHEAQDLTQEFFSLLLAGEWLVGVDRSKGKFRSFLLAAMNHLLLNEYHRARAQKRGGGAPHFSLDAITAEDRYRIEPVDQLAPDKLFERRWAETLLDRVVARLREEWDGRERAQAFEDLKVFLLDVKGTVSFEEVANRLGVTVVTVKSAVQKLRRRYRELFQDEIAQTVARPEDIEEEIRSLFQALGT